MRVALILGAGWSAAARYPGGEDLLRGPVYVGSEASRVRVQAVLDAYRRCDRPLEEFLARVRSGQVVMPPDPGDPSLFDRSLPWTWAVETVVLKLMSPGMGRSGDGAELLSARADFRRREGGHLGTPVHAEAHRELVASHDLAGVVTTNLDTLAEGVLGEFHYGGLPLPQRAQGAGSWEYYNDPDPESNAVELAGAVPLCKLHGSVNWELAGDRVVIWRDMRVPSRDPGRAAIFERLPSVWEAATEVLSAAEHWVVVGLAEPWPLLTACARAGALRSVALHDPRSAGLRPRWEELTGVPVEPLDGLSASAGTSVKLSFFYGIQVYMLRPPAEGAPPHFRALYEAERASIALADLSVTEGSLPARALSLVREWAGAHRAELERNWALAVAGAPEEPIAPLD